MPDGVPSLKILDPQFKNNAGRYLFQCALAALTILVVLLFLDVIAHTAIIATLGASAFIVFTMPHSYSSRPRSLLGGYFVGMSAGSLCYLLSCSRLLAPLVLTPRLSYVIFGALAVGVAILLMTVTNTEHPPAAGMALGLVLNQWDYSTVVFILAAVVFMTGVRHFLKGRLINLM